MIESNNYPLPHEVRAYVRANSSKLKLREFFTIEEAIKWSKNYNSIWRDAGVSVNIHGCKAYHLKRI